MRIPKLLTKLTNGKRKDKLIDFNKGLSYLAIRANEKHREITK